MTHLDTAWTTPAFTHSLMPSPLPYSLPHTLTHTHTPTHPPTLSSSLILITPFSSHLISHSVLLFMFPSLPPSISVTVASAITITHTHTWSGVMLGNLISWKSIRSQHRSRAQSATHPSTLDGVGQIEGNEGITGLMNPPNYPWQKAVFLSIGDLLFCCYIQYRILSRGISSQRRHSEKMTPWNNLQANRKTDYLSSIEEQICSVVAFITHGGIRSSRYHSILYKYNPLPLEHGTPEVSRERDALIGCQTMRHNNNNTHIWCMGGRVLLTGWIWEVVVGGRWLVGVDLEEG